MSVRSESFAKKVAVLEANKAQHEKNIKSVFDCFSSLDRKFASFAQYMGWK